MVSVTLGPLRRWRKVWQKLPVKSNMASRRLGRFGPGRPGLEAQGFEVGAEFVGQIGASQRELDRGLEKPELVAGVVAPALELDRVHRAAGAQHSQRVGQLDLAAGVRAGAGQKLEDLGRQHVAADDGQIRRRVLRLRLLNEVEDLVHAALDLPRFYDA